MKICEISVRSFLLCFFKNVITVIDFMIVIDLISVIDLITTIDSMTVITVVFLDRDYLVILTLFLLTSFLRRFSDYTPANFCMYVTA